MTTLKEFIEFTFQSLFAFQQKKPENIRVTMVSNTKYKIQKCWNNEINWSKTNKNFYGLALLRFYDIYETKI